MKKTVSKLFAVMLACGLAPVAQGATLEQVVDELKSIHDYAVSVVDTTASELSKLIYEEPAFMDETIQSNYATTLSAGEVKKTMANLSRQSLRSITQTTRINNPAVQKYASNDYQNTINYDAGSLLDESHLPNKTAAEAFLQYAVNLPNPQVQLSNADLRGKNPLITNAYIVGLRNFAALQSVGINNLNHLYTERSVLKGLGDKAGVKVLKGGEGQMGQPIADASPLQVDEFQAERRVLNPQWYRKMASASPAAVNREMLFLLAEMRMEMFKMRMELERLEASQAAQQVMMTQEQRGRRMTNLINAVTGS